MSKDQNASDREDRQRKKVEKTKDPKPGDPRLGTLFENDCEQIDRKLKVLFVGYPCDKGVIKNGGRPGARFGPESIMNRLPKIGPIKNPEYNIDLKTNLYLVDSGDVEVYKELPATHKKLEEKVTGCLKNMNDIVIVLGGGNDQSYINAKSLIEANNGGDIGVVNIDAHLDVRPLIKLLFDGNGNSEGEAHSGSPFRQLLEDEKFKGVFCEFATQGNQSSSEHAKFVEEKNGTIKWLSQVRGRVREEFEKVLCSFGERATFVSFDIDSIRRADCPGVSCPAAIGLFAEDALEICMAAGKHTYTRLLDISEFNPDIEQYDTSTLVCTMIYYFLMGVASRKNDK